jgi:hypothetical protein
LHRGNLYTNTRGNLEFGSAQPSLFFNLSVGAVILQGVAQSKPNFFIFLLTNFQIYFQKLFCDSMKRKMVNKIKIHAMYYVLGRSYAKLKRAHRNPLAISISSFPSPKRWKKLYALQVACADLFQNCFGSRIIHMYHFFLNW